MRKNKKKKRTQPVTDKFLQQNNRYWWRGTNGGFSPITACVVSGQVLVLAMAYLYMCTLPVSLSVECLSSQTLSLSVCWEEVFWFVFLLVSRLGVSSFQLPCLFSDKEQKLYLLELQYLSPCMCKWIFSECEFLFILLFCFDFVFSLVLERKKNQFTL